MTSNKGRWVWLPDGFYAVNGKLTQDQVLAANRYGFFANQYMAAVETAPELPPFEWSEEQITSALRAWFGPTEPEVTQDFHRAGMLKALNAAIGRG